MNITNKSLLTICSILCFSAFAEKQAIAVELIHPISYTATPGSGSGTGETYLDDTGTQLTDGIFGANNYGENLGNGFAYEWVGWNFSDGNVNINFIFDNSVIIKQVLIDFNRNESPDIYLPSRVIINGKFFRLKGTEIADRTRGSIKFNGPFTGPDLSITMKYVSGGGYIFVDEVQFVPAPAIRGTAPWETAHIVTCQNITQNATITIPATKASAWDCEKSGLPVQPNDDIKVTIEGKKY